MGNRVLCPAAELANGLAGSTGGHMRSEIQNKTLNYKSLCISKGYVDGI